MHSVSAIPAAVRLLMTVQPVTSKSFNSEI